MSMSLNPRDFKSLFKHQNVLSILSGHIVRQLRCNQKDFIQDSHLLRFTWESENIDKKSIMEFFLNVFSEFAEFSDKNIWLQ